MMTTQLRSDTRRLKTSIVCLLAITLTSGCSLFNSDTQPKQNKSEADAPFVPPDVDREPMLASSTPIGTSEFSATPMQDDIPFEPRTIRSLRQHSFTSEGSDSDPCISPDGASIVFASTRHNNAPDIYLKSVDGVAVTQLTADPSWDVQPTYSPDGSRIAFSSNRSGNWDIWVVDLSGRTPIQITNEAGDEVHPAWSPDGKELVYSRLPPRGQWELWVTKAATAASRRFIGYGLFPTWSPIGDTIAFQRARSRGSRWFSIWTLQLEGGEPGYPTEVAASANAALVTPAWSPDGQRLAYASVTPRQTEESQPAEEGQPAQTNASDIFVVHANGRDKQKLTDGYSANYAPTWSPDGRVYFSSPRGGAETIWSVNPDDMSLGNSGATASQDTPTEQKSPVTQERPRISDVGLANEV